MAKYSIEDSTLTNIANAIRAKTGGTAALKPTAMDEALNGIPTQAATTVTPSTADQTAVAKGVFTTGAVTVKGDANLKAENIAEGVSIFGVVGSHVGEKKTVRVTVTQTVGTSQYWYANAEGVATYGAINTGETHTIDAYGGAVACYVTRGATYTRKCVQIFLHSDRYYFVCLEDGCTITLTGSAGGGAD